MADVLLARSDGIEDFERHVVIKRIRPELARDQRFVSMFLDEARVAAMLHHQHIVQVHDIGEAAGEYFIAMEYVHGEDTRKLLATAAKQRTHVPLRYAIAIVSAAAAGLHAAHEQRGNDRRPLHIVHRDVSPSNILVGYDGSIKVLDFGIATASTQQETRSGSLKGKLSYMSPEQCKGSPVDRRTDIYALGAVLYELATTTRMIRGENDYQVMDQIVQGRIVPPQSRRAELPNALTDIIMCALATNRDDRYPTANDLRAALDQFAASAGLTASSSSIATYMTKQFGDVPEPWLELQDAPGVRLEDMPSKRFDASSSNNWGETPHGTGLRHTGSLPLQSGRMSRVTIDAGASAVARHTPRPPADSPPPTVTKQGWDDPSRPPVARRLPLWKLAPITVGPIVAALIWLFGSVLRPDPFAGTSGPALATAQPAPAARTPEAPTVTPLVAPAPAPVVVEPVVATAPETGAHAAEATARKTRAAAASASRTVAMNTAEPGRAKPRIDSSPRSDAGDGEQVRPLFAPLPSAPLAVPPPPPPVAPAAAPAVAPAQLAPAAPAAPQNVAPTALEANRIAGDKTILPDTVTMQEISRSHAEKVVSTYKVCVSADGAVDQVTQLKSSGFLEYDEKIRSAIRRDWRYRPYLVNGKAQPVCTAVRFMYAQR